MSFFGLENNDLELEKSLANHALLGGQLNNRANGSRNGNQIAEYTWGEESYDGLGDALQEGGDELNDETFGATADDIIAKDFDFTAQQALPDAPRVEASDPLSHSKPPSRPSSSTHLLNPTSIHDFLPSRNLQGSAAAPSPAVATTLRSAPRSSPGFDHFVDDRRSPSVLVPTSVLQRPSAGLPVRHSRPSPSPHPHGSFDPWVSEDAGPIIESSSSPSSSSLLPRHPQPTAPPSGLSGGVHQLSNHFQLREALERQQAEEYQRQLVRQEQEREIMLQQIFLQQQREQQREHQQHQRLLEQQQQQRFLVEQEREEEIARLLRLERENQILRQQQQQQRVLQDTQLLHRGTPPPRMLQHHHQQQQLPGHSQSPRFMEQQQRLASSSLQQHPDIVSQQALQRYQEQLLREEQYRQEELERQWKEEQLAQLQLLQLQQQQQQQQSYSRNGYDIPQQHQRQSSGPSPLELQQLVQLQALQQQQQQRREEMLLRQQRALESLNGTMADLRFTAKDGIYHPNSRGAAGPGPGVGTGIEQYQLLPEPLRAEYDQIEQRTVENILKVQREDEHRDRIKSKRAHMARYNDLMTQSDKDFITRIQVSQLVSQDPYADDYYAQMFGAIQRSKQGLSIPADRVLKFGSGGGIALGTPQKGTHRRPNAMHRMEQQVERIVNNARKREEEKGLHALSSLQGALGKTSGRSYKAAPRQLLQVDSGANIVSETKNDNSPTIQGREASSLPEATSESLAEKAPKREMMDRRQILVTLEHLYDLNLRLQDHNADRPSEEDSVDEMAAWKAHWTEITEQIWQCFKMDEDLEMGTHPFISLLTPIKGKRLLLRLAKLFDEDRQWEILMLLVASFDQLDVVHNAPLLDSADLEESVREEIDRHTNALSEHLLNNFSMQLLFATSKLPMLTGVLRLFVERNDVLKVLKSKPGLHFAAIILTESQHLAEYHEGEERPTNDDWLDWNAEFGRFFQIVLPHLLSLFPSVRMQQQQQQQGASSPTSPAAKDATPDEFPTWTFLAAAATNADDTQRFEMVSVLREKILHNVSASKQVWLDERQRSEKLSNVNMFLHAVGLDSSQISL